MPPKPHPVAPISSSIMQLDEHTPASLPLSPHLASTLEPNPRTCFSHPRGIPPSHGPILRNQTIHAFPAKLIETPLRPLFLLQDGSSHTVEGAVGMSVLRVAHAHGIDLEGACEASVRAHLLILLNPAP